MTTNPWVVAADGRIQDCHPTHEDAVNAAVRRHRIREKHGMIRRRFQVFKIHNV